MSPRGNQTVRENLTKQLRPLLRKPGIDIEDVVFALQDACALRVVELAPPEDPFAVAQLVIAQTAASALARAHEEIVAASRTAKKHAERLLVEGRKA